MAMETERFGIMKRKNTTKWTDRDGRGDGGWE
jgi:hypothetical protein